MIMAKVSEITAMCKAGRVSEACDIAKADYEACPDNLWTQIGLGWALYYKISDAVLQKDCGKLIASIRDLSELDLLNGESGEMIFTNVAWKLAGYVKTLPASNPSEADLLFSLFKKIEFNPSKGYSYLLSAYMKLENWSGAADFFEWWNLDNLQPEDYKPFKMPSGKQSMSLAERAYIGYAKALLRSGDKRRIEAFIPKMESLMENHPEMLYPGYFCGKLMIATGVCKDDVLGIVVPFVRKKKTEFWAWQLLADIYNDEPDRRLACLLRAVHSRAKEEFLGKVRLALAAAYLSRGDAARAKQHIDLSVRCYLSRGWRLPREVEDLTRQPWMQSAKADGSDGIEWQRATDCILAIGAHKSLAVVTYVDQAAKRASVVYGEKLRTQVRLSDLHCKVSVGDLLTLHWIPESDGKTAVVGAERISNMESAETSYVKSVSGAVKQRNGREYAFLTDCFVPPALVARAQLTDGRRVKALAVLDYNKKKNEWTWVCVSVEKL